MEVRNEVLRRITHEILNTKKSEEEIIKGIVEDTYLTAYEASLIYIEVLQNIVELVRKIGYKNNETKKSNKKK